MMKSLEILHLEKNKNLIFMTTTNGFTCFNKIKNIQRLHLIRLTNYTRIQ